MEQMLQLTTQLNDGAGGGPKQWHIFDTDLNQLYGWRYNNSAVELYRDSITIGYMKEISFMRQLQLMMN